MGTRRRRTRTCRDPVETGETASVHPDPPGTLPMALPRDNGALQRHGRLLHHDLASGETARRGARSTRRGPLRQPPLRGRALSDLSGLGAHSSGGAPRRGRAERASGRWCGAWAARSTRLGERVGQLRTGQKAQRVAVSQGAKGGEGP
jgi:hypothetical protein